MAKVDKRAKRAKQKAKQARITKQKDNVKKKIVMTIKSDTLDFFKTIPTELSKFTIQDVIDFRADGSDDLLRLMNLFVTNCQQNETVSLEFDIKAEVAMMLTMYCHWLSTGSAKCDINAPYTALLVYENEDFANLFDK